MNEKPELRWSDIWVLVSMYFSAQDKASEIQNIIRSADAINHAIITFEELSSALVRLTDNNLIEKEPNSLKFLCTPKSINIFKPITQKNSLMLKVWDAVEKVLNVEPWNPKDPIPNSSNDLIYPKFSMQKYTLELNKYLSDIRGKKST